MHRRWMWSSSLVVVLAGVMLATYATDTRLGDGWELDSSQTSHWPAVLRESRADTADERCDGVRQRPTAKRGPRISLPIAQWVEIGAVTPRHWFKVSG